jgi:tryptophan 2,3-dioxygenase
VDDNGGQLSIAVHRLRRVQKILEVLVKQFDVLETMTPLDFLDFRDMLRPASGFPEHAVQDPGGIAGLRMEHRHGKQYYTSQLKPADKARIEALEQEPTLIELVNAWLERMPFLQPNYWPAGEAPFFERLKAIYSTSLVEGEKDNIDLWRKIFEEGVPGHRMSAAANRAALFIMLYRDEPIFQQAYRFLEALLDIDQGLALWRSRHLNMVRRMIGMRTGTGGSTGSGYLKGRARQPSHLRRDRRAQLLPDRAEETPGASAGAPAGDAFRRLELHVLSPRRDGDAGEAKLLQLIAEYGEWSR